jgi:ABC-type bacteriocin/lantibiotic exporter with double-glycine peptidase domain
MKTHILREIYVSFIKKHWKYYVVLLVSLLSIPINQIGVPHYYGKIVDLLKQNKIDKASKTFTFLVLIWISVQFLNFIQNWASIQIWPRLTAHSESYIYTKLLDHYRGNFEELKVGEILTKIIKLPWMLDDIQDILQDFVLTSSVIVLSNFGYLTYHSPYLGLCYFVGACSLILCGSFYYNTCKDYKEREERQYDVTHGNIEDSLSNLISIYSSNNENLEKKKVEKETESYTKIIIEHGKHNIKYKAYFSIINVLIFIGLNATTLWLYKNKKIKLAALVSIFILNYNILGSLIVYFKNVRNYISIKATISYVNDFFESLPDIVKKGNKKIEDTTSGAQLIFENVGFKIKEENKEILKNVNFRIDPGENVLIMGKIGSGKSTIIRLLMSYQHHSSGEIYIAGKSIDDYSLEILRNTIQYVPQTPSLFNRTLWENLSYGFKEGEVKESDFITILEDLNMKETAQTFKEKMHKSVGKKGSHLSGGQRQIVWILRCLLKKAPVVILDEPTSALDEDSRNKVVTLMKTLQKKRTIIVISHDKDFLQIMDRLLLVDNGSIIQDKLLVKQTPF